MNADLTSALYLVHFAEFYACFTSSNSGTAAGDARGRSLELLAAFDEAWVTYLEQFAAWKLADAATLEVQLVSSSRTRSLQHFACKAVPEEGLLRQAHGSCVRGWFSRAAVNPLSGSTQQ